jgi:hypothetical protein
VARGRRSHATLRALGYSRRASLATVALAPIGTLGVAVVAAVPPAWMVTRARVAPELRASD